MRNLGWQGWLGGGLLGAWAAVGIAAAQTAAPQPAQIQLLSFMAPIRSAEDPSLREAPVTVFLDVADQTLVPAICELSPRLRDAFMEALFARPIPVLKGDKKLDTAAVEPMLLDAANKALRQNVVQAVTVAQGTQRFATGSSRSRATALGCSKIQ